MADRSTAVRKMSHDEASVAAAQLAQAFLATQVEDMDWGIAAVAADTFDPRPVGKTPSRWRVGATWKGPDPDGAVIDGGDATILVDLLHGTADWYRV